MHHLLVFLALVSPALGAIITGEILSAEKKQPIAARLYIQNERGEYFFAESVTPDGGAVHYDRQNGSNRQAIEKHTALLAHPFRANLPPGRYKIEAVRGKEFHPLTRTVEVSNDPVHLRLELTRFVNMAERGWYSGDTHVHRDPAELAAGVVQAEDLNVVLPMTDWTIESDVPPARSSRNIKGEFTAKPITLDATHVIYPRNSEYEIFQTGKQRHTLGAFVAINHRERLELPALPWRAIADKVRSEGGLIDFEKHNWEWSPAIAAIIQPDLFELANNHHWRSAYGATNWAVPAPAWMNIGSGGRSQREWTLYGFQTYYALLNCGFRPRPTAGTAHGVHPVPAGYGRVYVHLENGFSYDKWIAGLKAGRSFVTTGPMLITEVDGERPGHQFKRNSSKPRTVTVEARVFVSHLDGTKVEFVVNGQVVNQQTISSDSASRRSEKLLRQKIEIPESGWMTVRCWSPRRDGESEFAHTAPWWFDLGGLPARPRKQEVEWLAGRVREEIGRNQRILSTEHLREYLEALAYYENLLPKAKQEAVHH